MWTSVPQMATLSMRIRSSPEPAAGTGTSSRETPGPGAAFTSAFIVCAMALLLRRRPGLRILLLEPMRERPGEVHELARHHDDGRGVLLGAHLGDHLHAAQLERHGVGGQQSRCLAELLRSLQLGLCLDEASALLAHCLRLLRHRTLHARGQFDVLHLNHLDLDAPRVGGLCLLYTSPSP